MFRISTFWLVVAPAQSCCHVRNQSCKTNRLNRSYNEALRTISGCIRPTRVNLLPSLAGIQYFENCRHYACERYLRRAINQDHPLHKMTYAPTIKDSGGGNHMRRHLKFTGQAETSSIFNVGTIFVNCYLMRCHCALPLFEG